MVTLKLKNKPAIKFNLKSRERERELCGAVDVLGHEYPMRKIQLRTSFGETLEFATGDAESCKYVDAEYVRGTVREQPKAQAGPSDEELADKAMRFMKNREKKNLETFMGHLDPKTKRRVDDMLRGE